MRTGFNILDATFYELTKIVPVMMGENRCQIPSANGGWTGTACLAEKIAEPSVTWEGYIADTDTMYPG